MDICSCSSSVSLAALAAGCTAAFDSVAAACWCVPFTLSRPDGAGVDRTGALALVAFCWVAPDF
ncbi:hypothetical protein GUITHDRAFT_152523 [Guillardia theta CCMP2712]|uniref:Secreted protein n=1 Tax=Guillardia theta (strain CCMP2712) TaxID=905079 RepID=L1JDB7_GUITC|nr:hypothetical protein GUITHDRAFT_152523 [Guillardia theta CCMP2712]EKX46105.1 hypothetical protein GUITHDRAFT_152523 [Guillardia theta CCMP2712]|eukprot:XP_005833085.1 hypothetical protein GUITHDRAFT_152523 [Guillardia theta CCMP2712]